MAPVVIVALDPWRRTFSDINRRKGRPVFGPMNLQVQRLDLRPQFRSSGMWIRIPMGSPTNSTPFPRTRHNPLIRIRMGTGTTPPARIPMHSHRIQPNGPIEMGMASVTMQVVRMPMPSLTTLINGRTGTSTAMVIDRMSPVATDIRMIQPNGPIGTVMGSATKRLARMVMLARIEMEVPHGTDEVPGHDRMDSDPDANWSVNDGADAMPRDRTHWIDADGDDGDNPDEGPTTAIGLRELDSGTTIVANDSSVTYNIFPVYGCTDSDGDGLGHLRRPAG